MITEKLLHFIWQFQLFNTAKCYTTAGEEFIVVNKGVYNTNEGPDFLMAQIKMGNVLLSGAVEIHILSSDWHKHRHDTNTAYSNVILHVVYEDDMPVEGMKTLALKSFLPEYILAKYKLLSANQQLPYCASLHPKPDKNFATRLFFERLAVERLQRKVALIHDLLKNNANDWDKVALILIAKYLGGKVNGAAFEQLMQSLSVSQLRKIADHPVGIEAVFLGMANLLNEEKEDDYYRLLRKEYQYYKRLFQLTVNPNLKFNFLRLRPASFPTIRLSQLADFLHRHPHYFSLLIQENSIAFFQRFFELKAAPYWDTHFTFDDVSPAKPKKAGTSVILSLLINAVVPLKFAYADYSGDELLKEKAIQFLAAMPAEKNARLDSLNTIGLSPDNAMESQALLELYENYCLPQKCLSCLIGKHLLTKL